MTPATLDVIRVFTAPDGRGGNPLGVFLEAGVQGDEAMQGVAADLGFSETVFVTDRERAAVRIFTPATELPLAGHPLVGTSWLMHERGSPPSVLRPPPGDVPTWRDGELTWICANPQDAPDFDLVELSSPEEVHDLTASPDGGGMTVAWAWSDESVGTVRARAFLADLGIAEDEATGSAALRLCAQEDRPLAIHQGVGSLLHTRPGERGLVELGGHVAPVEQREYDLPT